VTSTPGTEPVSHIHHTLGHAHTDTAMDAGTNRAQMLAHGRTWPDSVGHATRPLTFVPAGQRPCCAGGGW
jgi:hypothetical protein